MFSIFHVGFKIKVFQGKRPSLLSLAVNFREPQRLIRFCRDSTDLIKFCWHTPLTRTPGNPWNWPSSNSARIQNSEYKFSSLWLDFCRYEEMLCEAADLVFFMIHPISQTNALSRNQIIVNPTRSFLFMKAQGYSFKYLDKKEKSLKKNWVICIKWCNAKPQDVLLWVFLDNLCLGFKSAF